MTDDMEAFKLSLFTQRKHFSKCITPFVERNEHKQIVHPSTRTHQVRIACTIKLILNERIRFMLSSRFGSCWNGIFRKWDSVGQLRSVAWGQLGGTSTDISAKPDIGAFPFYHEIRQWSFHLRGFQGASSDLDGFSFDLIHWTRRPSSSSLSSYALFALLIASILINSTFLYCRVFALGEELFKAMKV